MDHAVQDRIVSFGIGMPQRPEYANSVYWCVMQEIPTSRRVLISAS